MKISVIIPTWQRSSVLSEVLEGLCKQNLNRDRFEVIVCDSNSPDDTPAIINEYSNRLDLSLIHTSMNAVGAKRNAGALAAAGDLLVFLDDDVVPTPSLLQSYSENISGLAKTVLVGISKFSITRADASNFIRYRNSRSDQIYAVGHNVPSNLFVSMNFAILREAYFDIGMFDENFTNYGGEDHDFPSRLLAKGYAIKLCSQAISEHREPNSNILSRMKKICISGRKGFVPLNDKHPNFSKATKLHVLERTDTFAGGVVALIFYFCSGLGVIKLICRCLMHFESNPKLYSPTLFRFIFAYAYFEGVRYRGKKDDENPAFYRWHFWENM